MIYEKIKILMTKPNQFLHENTWKLNIVNEIFVGHIKNSLHTYTIQERDREDGKDTHTEK